MRDLHSVRQEINSLETRKDKAKQKKNIKILANELYEDERILAIGTGVRLSKFFFNNPFAALIVCTDRTLILVNGKIVNDKIRRISYEEIVSAEKKFKLLALRDYFILHTKSGEEIRYIMFRRKTAAIITEIVKERCNTKD